MIQETILDDKKPKHIEIISVLDKDLQETCVPQPNMTRKWFKKQLQDLISLFENADFKIEEAAAVEPEPKPAAKPGCLLLCDLLKRMRDITTQEQDKSQNDLN